MEVGEPVSVAPPVTPPDDVELAAELVSVNFKSTLKTSHAKATIAGPHWQAGQDRAITDDWKNMAKKLGLPPEPYSKRAAVYRVKGAGGKYDVEVKIKVTKSKNVSGDAKLVGNLKGLMIEGTCPTSVGEHTVAATFTEPPEDIQAYRGKISWRLDAAGAGVIVALGTTLAEIYFILGRPTKPFEDIGVWAEVLRFLVGKAGVAGKDDEDAVSSRVTSYCFGEHGLRYATNDGLSRYGTSGETFSLAFYIQRRQPDCNCYDQASAIQVLVGALGIHVAWCLLDPYGYIRSTRLVGIAGDCNNPFFGNNERLKLLPWNSPYRQPFGNHAFARTRGNRILDACGGPHLGTESSEQYVGATVDTTPALYEGLYREDGRKFRPGKASDIVVMPAIESVD